MTNRWSLATLSMLLIAMAVEMVISQSDSNVTVISCVDGNIVLKLGDMHQFACEIEIEPFPSSRPLVFWFKNVGVGGATNFQPLSTVHPAFEMLNSTYPSANSVRGEAEAEFVSSDMFGDYEIRIAGGLSQELVYHTSVFSVQEAELPRPPILRLSAPLNSGLKLEWAVRQGIAPVRRYEIQRRSKTGPNSTSEWITATRHRAMAGSAFEVTLITALASFTSYQFRVRAENDFGWGNYSSASDFFTTLPNSPLPATNLMAINSTDASVTLRWQLSPDFTRSQGIIEQYTIVYQPSNASLGRSQSQPVMVTAGTNITVATVNGLRKGTEYRFHVVADNGFFKAKDSNIITVTTNTSHPGNFTYVKATPVSHEWILLELGEIDNGGSPLTKMMVHYRSIEDEDHGEWTFHSTLQSPPKTHLMIRELQENSTYQFRIVVHNRNGKGRPTSFSDFVTTKVFMEPKDAEAATVVSKNPISVKLRWSSQECPTSSSASPAKIVKNDYDLCQDAAGDMAVPVIGYTVQHRLVGSLTWIPAEVAIGLNPSLEYDLQGLEQASEYEVRVLSRNEYGASPGKELLTVETDEGRPSLPEIISLTPMKNSINVEWRLPSDTGLVSAYPADSFFLILLDDKEIEVSRSPIKPKPSSMSGSSVLDGLTASRQYTVRVVAENTFGSVSSSHPFTSGSDAPLPPTSPPDIFVVTSKQPSTLSNTNLIIIIAASVLAPTILLILNLILICCCRRRRKELRKRAWEVEDLANMPPHPSPPPPPWSRSADNVTTTDSYGAPVLAQRSAWDNRVRHETGFESTTSLPALMGGGTYDGRALSDMGEEAAEASNIPTTFTSFGVDSPNYLPPPPLITDQ